MKNIIRKLSTAFIFGCAVIFNGCGAEIEAKNDVPPDNNSVFTETKENEISDTESEVSITEGITTTTKTQITEPVAEDEDIYSAEQSEENSSETPSFDIIDELNDEANESEGILSSAEDIGLYDTDGRETYYSFTYDEEVYSAIYTPDNWKIIDSYKITNKNDITYICEALSEQHLVHGSDMQSFRTPDDMAYEWIQHNIAYRILPESNSWRKNAKDVDINPTDQGKNIYEMYKAKTGRTLTVFELLK